MKEKARILILAGSRSDLPRLEKAERALEALGVPCEVKVASAHRTPEETAKIVAEAAAGSVRVIIAAAGLANHLAGAAAARTIRPVIGVPLSKSPLQGLDSLLSTVQMPPGVPVATVGIDGAENAAILAAEILALEDPGLEKKLLARREEMRRAVLERE